MATIDVQVHCYERNHPGRPWHAVLAGPPEVTGPDMIKAPTEMMLPFMGSIKGPATAAPSITMTATPPRMRNQRLVSAM